MLGDICRGGLIKRWNSQTNKQTKKRFLSVKISATATFIWRFAAYGNKISDKLMIENIFSTISCCLSENFLEMFEVF